MLSSDSQFIQELETTSTKEEFLPRCLGADLSDEPLAAESGELNVIIQDAGGP